MDHLQYDYAESFNEIKDEEAREFQELLAAYREIFSTNSGKRVLKHLLDIARVNSPAIYTKGAEIYKNAAIHDFATEHLVQMVFLADPEIYMDMVREQITTTNERKQEK